MKAIGIIFRREMMSYFFSPIAYIVAVCVLFLDGFNVYLLVSGLNRQPSDYNVFQVFFWCVPTWLIIFIIPPFITMRLFADEKRMGTIETLMTTSLRDWEYVLGKFFPALLFYAILWAPTFNMVFVLRHFANDTSALDLGPILGGYLGVFGVGMLYLSIGCMTSACTRNQIVAAVLAFAIGCGIFFSGMLFYTFSTDRYREFFEYFSMYAHMEELCRGILEWKRMVFYLSGTFFFLYVTHRIVQSRQWKN